MLTDEESALWNARGRRLLEQAISQDDADVIGIVEAALAALRIAANELPPDELEGYPFPGEPEPERPCICPPDLLERGGHRGGCPVHSFR